MIICGQVPLQWFNIWSQEAENVIELRAINVSFTPADWPSRRLYLLEVTESVESAQHSVVQVIIMIHTISLRSSLLILAPDVVCLRIGAILREATVYCAVPLSFSSHAWQLGPDNLCLAPVNRRQPPHPPPTNEAGRMAIHPQGGSWCATVQMLITGATLANWQSPIQRSPCECVPSSKSRACVSLLIPDMDWFSGSPCWPLLHNTTLHPPPPPGCPSMSTDRAVAKTPNRPGPPRCAVALWGNGAVALWQAPIRTPSIIMSVLTESPVSATEASCLHQRLG